MEIWFCAQDLFWIWVQFWFCLWDKIIKNVMVNNSLKWGPLTSVLGWINSWDVYLQIQLSNVSLWTLWKLGWWHQCMFSTILSHRQNLNLNQSQIRISPGHKIRFPFTNEIQVFSGTFFRLLTLGIFKIRLPCKAINKSNYVSTFLLCTKLYPNLDYLPWT